MQLKRCAPLYHSLSLLTYPAFINIYQLCEAPGCYWPGAAVPSRDLADRLVANRRAECDSIPLYRIKVTPHLLENA